MGQDEASTGEAKAQNAVFAFLFFFFSQSLHFAKLKQTYDCSDIAGDTAGMSLLCRRANFLFWNISVL